MAVRDSGLDSPYKSYVSALANSRINKFAAANDFLAAYPTSGEPDDLLKADFRRQKAATVLRDMAVAHWGGAKRNEALDTPPDDVKKQVVAWLDRAASIAPNDKAPLKVTAYQAMAAWPNEPDKAMNLTTNINNDEAVKELGPDAALFLWVKAQSNGQNIGRDQRVAAVQAYDKLANMMREQLRTAPADQAGNLAKEIVDKVLAVALPIADKMSTETDEEFRVMVGRMYALKGRTMINNLNKWELRAGATKANESFQRAIQFSDKRPERAAYLVEGILALDCLEGKPGQLGKPGVEELAAVADTAKQVDKEHFLPALLSAKVELRRGNGLSEMRKYKEADEKYAEAVKLYKDAFEKTKNSDHPEKEKYQSQILVSEGSLHRALAKSAPNPEVEQRELAAARDSFGKLRELNKQKPLEDPIALVELGKFLEDSAWPRGDKKNYEEAEQAIKAAIEKKDDAGFRVDLGRLYVRWVMFGGQKMDYLDSARNQFDKVIKQSTNTRETSEAYYFLGTIRAMQAGPDDGRIKAFDESRSKFKEACKQSPNEGSYWQGRIEGLVAEAELDRTRIASAVRARRRRPGTARYQRRSI